MKQYQALSTHCLACGNVIPTRTIHNNVMIILIDIKIHNLPLQHLLLQYSHLTFTKKNMKSKLSGNIINKIKSFDHSYNVACKSFDNITQDKKVLVNDLIIDEELNANYIEETFKECRISCKRWF
jgi:hypothetical protein